MDVETPFGPLQANDARELLNCPTELDRQILAYSRHWILVGIFLRCTTCGASQKASDSAQPFLHLAECKAKHLGHDFPWRQLLATLSQLPVDRLAEATR
jgi:hypothetical protein